jgi:hypothetical protein
VVDQQNRELQRLVPDFCTYHIAGTYAANLLDIPTCLHPKVFIHLA